MNSLEKYRRYLETTDDSAEYWAEGAVLEFTEDLSRIMDEAGISRSELAEKLGTSKSYITKIFSGQANFTLETMAKFAHAIGRVLRVHLAPADSITVYIDRPISQARATTVVVPIRGSDVTDNVVRAVPQGQGFEWTAKVTA